MKNQKLLVLDLYYSRQKCLHIIIYILIDYLIYHLDNLHKYSFSFNEKYFGIDASNNTIAVLNFHKIGNIVQMFGIIKPNQNNRIISGIIPSEFIPKIQISFQVFSFETINYNIKIRNGFIYSNGNLEIQGNSSDLSFVSVLYPTR